MNDIVMMGKMSTSAKMAQFMTLGYICLQCLQIQGIKLQFKIKVQFLTMGKATHCQCMS